jgi:flagellar basal-body rod protein FlgB
MAISVVDPTQSVLIAAMRGAELNQTLLTSDLANADTPGFQPSSVAFQSQLASAIDSSASNGGDASGQGSTSIANMAFTPSTAAQTTGTDGNGVDSDQTSAALAENGLLYDSLAEVLSTHDSILEYAMGTK